MDEFGYFFDVLALLIAAVVVVSVLKSLKISPIIGFLLAGLIIGPSGLSFIGSVEQVKHLAEFGVVFLLFIIGLELPWERLMTLKRYVFGLGGLQVSLTMLLFSFLGYFFFHLTISVAVLVGGALALSSTAIVMQLLAEREDMAARYGRIGFSVLLFQDLSVVGFLILLNIMVVHKGAEHATLLSSLMISLLKVVGVLFMIALIGRYLLRPIYKWVASVKNSELFVALSFLIILTTSYSTHAAGLSMELGAFLAGVLLAETEYKHQVEADIQPFKALLLGLFFMTVGMDLKLAILLAHPVYIISVVLALIILKSIVMLIACRIMSIGWSTTIRLMLMLAAGGEFAFVIFLPMQQSGLLSFELQQTLLLSVSLSMALTPLLAFLGRKLSSKLIKISGKELTEVESRETASMQDHIILVGFGRVGQTVAKILSQHLIPYVAIDLNMKEVNIGRKQGLSVFFGDARRSDIFKTLGADRASSIVLTLDKQSTISRCVMMLRRQFPNASLFVRAQDVEQAKKLEKAGANVIVPELLEPSLQLAGSVMSFKGISADEITSTLTKLKNTILSEITAKDGILSEKDENKN